MDESQYAITLPPVRPRFSFAEDIKNNPLTALSLAVSVGSILKSRLFWTALSIIPRVAARLVKPALLLLIASKIFAAKKHEQPQYSPLTSTPENHHE